MPSKVRSITGFKISTKLTFAALDVRLGLAWLFVDSRHDDAYHCDSIRYTNGVVLPRKHALLLDGVFDNLPKIQHCIGD